MIDIEKMKALAAFADRLRVEDTLCKSGCFTEEADLIYALLSELEAREADRRDAERYRGLLDALLCGDIPMKESSISLNVCGVPPDREEFDEAVDFALAQRQEGEEK